MLGCVYHNYDYDYVIRQNDGSIYNPNSVTRIVKRLMQQAGLPIIRLHDLRHSVASTLFDMGVPLPEITKQIGHGQTSTTELIYVHGKNITPVDNPNLIATSIGI